MLILSHRGNVTGPNTINLAVCRRHRWGVELDLRWEEGRAYFDHTPRGHTSGTDASAILRQLKDQTVAVDIKDVGREMDAVTLLEPYPDAFVFDMELCGARPVAYFGLPRAVRISNRRDEQDVNKFKAEIVWLDEFEPWVKERHVKSIHEQGKSIYWVSPELHKPLTAPHEFRRLEEHWREMISWGVDGVCTDYPQMLARHMEAVEV